MRTFVVDLSSCAGSSAVIVANSPSDASAQTLSGEAAVAQSYTSAPYGIGGLECSGFTSAIYADLGVPLPDDPVARYGCGTVIHTSTYCGTVESSVYDVTGYMGAMGPT